MKINFLASNLRRLSSLVFRKPSRILQEINSNALMVEWSRSHRTDVVFENRSQLYEYLNSIVLNAGPVDYLEFGVYKGNSILEWVATNKHEQSRFFGFDTFDGLPEQWHDVRRFLEKSCFSTDGKPPDTSDCRMQFVQGLFQDTLPVFPGSLSRERESSCIATRTSRLLFSASHNLPRSCVQVLC